MTDTSIVQERISDLCHQFKLPTVGVEAAPRFTAAGHGEALSTLLEVLEQEAEDRNSAASSGAVGNLGCLPARPGRPSSTTGWP